MAAEERFNDLLQPIRDLAANWNVDISRELEEYLEVLEGLTFSFEGGPSLNFAEAALLIQGSACVYSKKVEYLHSLVYQALEFVAERKRKDQKTKDASDRNNDDDNEFDDEEQFLSLDDVLDEGAGIDLEDEGEPVLLAPTRLPATLLALEGTEGAGQGEHDIGKYRLAACSIHHSGALLLEARDGDALDEWLEPIIAMPSYLTHTVEQQQQQAQEAMQQDGYDDYDDGGGFGEFPADGDYDEAAPVEQDTNDVTMMEAGTLAEGAAVYGDNQQPELHVPHEEAVVEEEEEEFFDPYAPLDPSDRDAVAAKPFKRFSRLPTRPRGKTATATTAAAEALLTSSPPVNGPLLPEFQYAWEALQRTQAHSRRAQQQSLLQGRVGGGSSRDAAAAQLASAFTLQEAVAAGDNGMADDDDYNDAGGAFDTGDYEEDDYDGGDGPPAEGFDFAAVDWEAEAGGYLPLGDGTIIPPPDAATAEELTYEELCRAHIEAFISAAAASEVQTELAGRVSCWRLRMEPVLQEEDARPEFDIKMYGEQILDKLESLTCSDDGVETTKADAPAAKPKKKGDKTTAEKAEEQFGFGDIVSDLEDKYQVSRMFSSMLQLINAGNIAIDRSDSEEFSLTLLKGKTAAAAGNNGVFKLPQQQPTATPSAMDDSDSDGPGEALSPVKTNAAVAVGDKPQPRRGSNKSSAVVSKRRKA